MVLAMGLLALYGWKADVEAERMSLLGAEAKAERLREPSDAELVAEYRLHIEGDEDAAAWCVELDEAVRQARLEGMSDFEIGSTLLMSMAQAGYRESTALIRACADYIDDRRTEE